MTDEESMWVSAVRYALGRQTYIVVSTVEFMASKSRDMSDQCRGVMIRDIQESRSLETGKNKDDWWNLLYALGQCSKK